MNKLLVLLLLCSFVCFVSTGDINIDLSLYHPNIDNYNVFKRYLNVTNLQTNINITNINDDVGFFVIQIHTYAENVTLSNSTKLSYGNFVTGINIGLVWGSEDSDAMFYLIRNIKVEKNVQVLLVISIYDQNDPVPGGCNLSFNTPVAPYQLIKYTDDVIIVNSQPPSAIGAACNDKEVQVDMYHLYLYEYDNSVDTYFKYLEKMLSVRDILKYGTKVPDIGSTWKYRRMYSSYRGTGEVFAIVARNRNNTSAYVPGVSYGCDVLKWNETCVGPIAVHWKYFCACLLFFGTFVCFFGHRCFKLSLYIISFTFGLSVTYLIISMEEYFSFTEKTITAFTVGFMYGIIWLLIWRRFGLPVLTVNLTFISSGFLAASLLFNTVLADIYIFTDSVNFWLAFLSTVLICVIVSLPYMMHGHIASLSFLGAYGCVIALNFCFGGNLQYIIINTYRRVAVKDFNTAVIDPPIHLIDIVQALFWLSLFLFGMSVQLRHQRNKPPFPPNRSGSIRRVEPPHDSEVAPLLYRDIFAPPQYTG